MIRLFLTTAVFLSSLQAFAISPIHYKSKNVSNKGTGLSDTYRIGDEWGKIPVTDKDLDSDSNFRRMALATAKVGGGGTGFYLGYYNGKHVMATNHHVCPSATQCLNTNVNFTLLKMTFRIVEFYGSWTDVDLALFAIHVPDVAQEAILNENASPFDYSMNLYRGQPLTTIGYGTGSNPFRVLVANRDSDCVVFSDTDEFRFMGDPDDLNPGPYKAWSFANGCDVSHGDSGSAMMDRQTGKVVGIIWTGRIPKDPKVQNSKYLDGLLAQPTEEVWKQLSYSVPAKKIQAHLKQLILDGKIPAEFVPTVSEVVQ